MRMIEIGRRSKNTWNNIKIIIFLIFIAIFFLILIPYVQAAYYYLGSTQMLSPTEQVNIAVDETFVMQCQGTSGAGKQTGAFNYNAYMQYNKTGAPDPVNIPTSGENDLVTDGSNPESLQAPTLKSTELPFTSHTVTGKTADTYYVWCAIYDDVNAIWYNSTIIKVVVSLPGNQYEEEIPQTITLTADSVNEGNFSKLFTQEITTNTLIDNLGNFPKITNQKINSFFNMIKYLGREKEITQLVTLTPSVERMYGLIKVASQKINANILTNTITDFRKITVNSITLTASRTSGLGKSIIQAITLTPSVERLYGVLQGISQAITANIITDNIADFRKITIQAITTNILTTRTSALSKSIIQAITLSSLVDRLPGIMQSVSQQIIINTLISKSKGFMQGIIQSINLNLLTSRVGNMFRIPIFTFSLNPNVIPPSVIQSYFTDVANRINMNTLTGSVLTRVRNPIQNLNLNFITAPTSTFFKNVLNSIIAVFKLMGFEPEEEPEEPPPGPSVIIWGGGGYIQTPQLRVAHKEIGAKFTEIPLIIENPTGQTKIIGVELTNKLDEEVEVDIKIDGSAQDWIILQVNKLILAPKGKRRFSYIIEIPEDAREGDYLIKISAIGKGIHAADASVLRVRDVPIQYDKPIFMRHIKLDRDKEKTDIEIEVNNPTEREYPAVQVIENVPKIMAESSDEIEFISEPTSILEDDPLILWSLFNLKSGDNKSIFYSIGKILEDYSYYVYWPLEQINIISQETPETLKLIYLKIRISEIKLKIKNLDIEEHTFKFSMDMPADWRLEPEVIDEVIQGGEEREFSFNVLTPAEIEKKTYILRAIIEWNGNIAIREYKLRLGISVYLKAFLYTLGIFLFIFLVLKMLTKFLRKDLILIFGPWLKFGREKLKIDKGTEIIKITLSQLWNMLDLRERLKKPKSYYIDWIKTQEDKKK